MKVIILAGGLGTRLSEYTGMIPKPMVTVGGIPIIWHIMRSYAHFGHKDFFLALGHKEEVVKEYFLHYSSLNSDFTVDLSSGMIESHQTNKIDWRVTLVQTGFESMTGGRVKRLQSYIGKEPFMLTYGDGVANIDLDALLIFHKNHGKMVTITAVHPGARFGELEIVEERVITFKEKPQITQGWVNGGYFIIEPEFFELIDGDGTILEHEPLMKAVEMNEVMAYQHDGYWQCMDTKRDRDSLEELWRSNLAPWKV
jgi:glucose-1-phosphate cytidylyltransferase